MPARQRSKAAERQRNARGSARDRQARRVWLLATFSPELGPTLARCTLGLSPVCLKVVDDLTLTVDRIVAGGPYTRDNIKPACQPCQSHQGGVIGPQRRNGARDEGTTVCIQP